MAVLTKQQAAFGTLLIALCTTLVLKSAPDGSVITVDSKSYLAASRSLSQGLGPVADGKWLTHFPPFFPLVLSLLSVFGNDPSLSARYLNAVLFGINACLVAWLVLSESRSVQWAAFAGLLTASMNQLLLIHTNVWSEPLFNAIMLLALARVRSGRDDSAAVLLGLASITRYAGLGLNLGCLIRVATIAGSRWRRIARFAAISTGPLILILATNRLIAGNTMNRPIYFEWAPVSRYLGGIDELATIMLPQATPFAVKVACILMFGMLIAWNARQSSTFEKTVLTVTGVYVVFLMASLLVVDHRIEFDIRIQSPAIFLSIVAACCGAARQWPRVPAIALAAVLTTSMGLGCLRTARWLFAGH